MPVRPWSRLALALLLLWQLNAAVAFSAPHVAASAQTNGISAAHCARHAHAGPDLNRRSTADPAVPQAPDCCHSASAMCQCAQIPGLALSTLEFGEAPPPDPPPVPGTAPHPDTRGTDFFRPPI